MKNLPSIPKKNRKRGADEQLKQKMTSGAKYSACAAFGHNLMSCKHKRDTIAAPQSIKDKKKTAGTVLGKRKFDVGSSSNAPQKKKKTIIASFQPPSQPILSSQPPSQPLSQNAPTSQAIQSSTVLGNLQYSLF
ncbi:hypothetical protein ACOSQ2_004606 [Xanthoceras sorbifolium]